MNKKRAYTAITMVFSGIIIILMNIPLCFQSPHATTQNCGALFSSDLAHMITIPIGILILIFGVLLIIIEIVKNNK